MESWPTPTFAPARSKFEAVARIGRLTSTQQSLGPGSKERKSALVAINDTLRLGADTTLRKPELGESLAARLGVPWTVDCFSAGNTITLAGLNRLLEPLERTVETGPLTDGSPASEASRILSIAAPLVRGRWHGRSAIELMRLGTSTQWAQDEWAGFYFEFLLLPELVRSLGGGPVTVRNTRFDYQRQYIWDLKWHGADRPSAPLNDASAIRDCVATRGVGFIVLSGAVDYDQGEFRAWQSSYRLLHGRRPRPNRSPSAIVRRSKPAFTPGNLEAFFITDERDLEQALRFGALRVMRQGRQASGAARAEKYSLHLPRARQRLLVATHKV